MLSNNAHTNHVWKKVEDLTSLKDVWDGDSIADGLRGWCENGI